MNNGHRKACAVGRRLCSALVLAFLLSIAPGRSAVASLLGPSRLDRSFCHLPTLRQTIVYIDDSIIVNGANAWALELDAKLRASLMPGERVTIVRLSPETGTSQEIWSGCWPDLSASERRKHKRSWFSALTGGSLSSQLREQQNLFARDLNRALTEIYVKAKKLQPNTRIPAANAPKKRIIEALASDAARFAQSDKTNRVIVYSDLAQNSSLASVFSNPPTNSVNIGPKLGVYFPHTLFYFYGVGSDISGDPSFLSSAHHLWKQVLASMSAALAAMGSNLAVPNRIPVAGFHYGVRVDRQGQTFYGKMWLLTDHDGHLIDSWLGISRLKTVPINGTLVCHDSDSCRLRATTVGSLTTTNNTESIDMRGSSPAKLAGEIGVRGALTFPISATLRKN